MSTIKNFKLRKIYQRKKVFTLKNIIKNNYILITSSNDKKTLLINNLQHIDLNYIPSYLQVEKISTGGVVIKLVPKNFEDSIKKSNIDFKGCMSVFYNNKWYPRYLLKNIRNYEKNLLSILILLKELKLK